MSKTSQETQSKEQQKLEPENSQLAWIHAKKDELQSKLKDCQFNITQYTGMVEKLKQSQSELIGALALIDQQIHKFTSTSTPETPADKK